MDPAAPANFYTGIVVDVYGPLRGSTPDAESCAVFIRRSGEPALELGCGSGDPLLTLVESGLEVEGLDSSPDMLARLESDATDRGLDVTTHLSAMETMDLGRRYRSIFLAGPTFNLLPDDAAASQALERIAAHLEPDGAALIPLFIPEPVPEQHLGVAREHVEDSGRRLRVTAASCEHDAATRTQITMLRYEIIDGDHVQAVEKPWLLHWYSQDQFTELATAVGLEVRAINGLDGLPAPTDCPFFTCELRQGAG
ncbi:MAG: class I SAM-dependent methyltransferase [Actinomycetota bacterium]